MDSMNKISIIYKDAESFSHFRCLHEYCAKFLIFFASSDSSQHKNVNNSINTGKFFHL